MKLYAFTWKVSDSALHFQIWGKRKEPKWIDSCHILWLDFQMMEWKSFFYDHDDARQTAVKIPQPLLMGSLTDEQRALAFSQAITFTRRRT